MKYGMNLLLWTGDVTEEHFPLLEKIKGWGFDGVELLLMQMKEEAKMDMILMCAFDEVPDNIESAKGIQTVYEQMRSRWAAFLMEVAGCYSSIASHCLALVQQYYTEARLISVRGRTGWENLADFKGAQLRNQIDVRVSAGSIEPRTRQAIEQPPREAAHPLVNGLHADGLEVPQADLDRR